MYFFTETVTKTKFQETIQVLRNAMEWVYMDQRYEGWPNLQNEVLRNTWIVPNWLLILPAE